METQSSIINYLWSEFKLQTLIPPILTSPCVPSPPPSLFVVMPLAIDLLNPSQKSEEQRHKLKRLVQSPNSYFMDVKCPGCFAITTVFSHAQTVVLCGACSSVLCQPTGGKARLTEGSSYRRKN